MRYLVINTKNYLQATGSKLEQICSFVEKIPSHKVRTYLAIPAFELRILKGRFNVQFLTQHLDDSAVGSSTGWLVPEIAKLEGAKGSILNHSEHRAKVANIANLVSRLRELKMISLVCARSVAEVSKFSSLAPDFVAIEPPELIGTGRAVSKYTPAIIHKSRIALENERPHDKKTKLLCGAGIMSGEDVRRSIELGSDGVLVASGVVLAKSWKDSITDLLSGFDGVEQIGKQ